MGLPGFSGFIAELQVLVGAWKTFPLFTVLAGLGIVVGVAYTMRVVVRGFFSDSDRPLKPVNGALPAISLPEKAGALLLLTVTLVVGIYPRLLLDLITPSLNSPLFERMWKGGA
jgi:NADH-quinone oxidoreductase subunit M